MSIEAGNLLMPMLAADGQVVAYRMVRPEKAEDLVVPLLAADGAPVGLKVVSMTKQDDVGFGGLAADGVVVALKTKKKDEDQYYPVIIKVCSGPGNGMIGEWRWIDEEDHEQGIEIWYQTIGEYYIGFCPYREDQMFGPIICPYGSYNCTDAVWYVQWAQG